MFLGLVSPLGVLKDTICLHDLFFVVIRHQHRKEICMQASKISKQARSENREQDVQKKEKEGMYKKMMRPCSTEEK